VLVYPFSVQCVYIPIMPPSLCEYLEAPTPFIMGIHEDVYQTLDPSRFKDVITVFVDSAQVPSSDPLDAFQGVEATQLRQELRAILKPDLIAPDLAYPVESQAQRKDPKTVERLLRIAFLQFFALMLQDYREFVPLMRMFPEQIVFFQKRAFLRCHPSRKDFLEKFLPTGMFDNFIREDAASKEKTLFSMCVEECNTSGSIQMDLGVDVAEFMDIKNPIESGETGPASPPFNPTRPLEFASYGPPPEVRQSRLLVGGGRPGGALQSVDS